MNSQRLKNFLSIILTFSGFNLLAQSNFIPLNEDYYHRIDRYEIKAGKIFPHFFSSLKQYKRSDVVAFIDSVYEEGLITSKADQFNYEYFRNDSWEWARPETNESKKPILKTFYKKKSDLLYVDVPDFDLHINPVIYFGAGSDSRLDDIVYMNTRGVEIRGMVDKKLGFYSYLADNQARLPSYVQDYQSQYWVVPHEGFWKSFKDNGVDFLQARGYVTYDATKSINLQVGYDRFFIGNGYRSLILSDFAAPSFYFKFNVKVWKLNYLYSINQMKENVIGTSTGSGAAEQGYPNKGVVNHHLSINIGKKLNIGLFETIIFSSDDSIGTGKFELSYINPIIFFRAIEQQNGSADNAIIGADFKWNAAKKISFYGQVVFDEFLLDNLREGDGWWANKWAIQFGGKYVDAFGLSNLDLQLEGNVVRPYTYSHNTDYGNYSGYSQSLAHPLGANFNEVVGIMRYQPLPRLNLIGKLIYTNIGRDNPDVPEENWGSDMLKDNTTRENDYNNSIGQGIENTILFGSFTASWMLKHNLFVDAQLVVRKSDSDLSFYDQSTTMTCLALRWNIAQRLYEF
jgi:hypothetical protein